MDSTMASVVVGALLGFASAFLVARYQGNREDRHRYAEIKQTKYAEFVRLSRSHVRTLQQQMDIRVHNPLVRPAFVPTLESTEPIDELSAEIAILGPERVWKASRDMFDAIVALDAWAWDDERPPTYLHGEVDVGDYVAALDVFNRGLSTFLEEAKRDLGTLKA